MTNKLKRAFKTNKAQPNIDQPMNELFDVCDKLLEKYEPYTVLLAMIRVIGSMIYSTAKIRDKPPTELAEKVGVGIVLTTIQVVEECQKEHQTN